MNFTYFEYLKFHQPYTVISVSSLRLLMLCHQYFFISDFESSYHITYHLCSRNCCFVVFTEGKVMGTLSRVLYCLPQPAGLPLALATLPCLHFFIPSITRKLIPPTEPNPVFNVSGEKVQIPVSIFSICDV